MNYSFDYTKYLEQLVPLLKKIETVPLKHRDKVGQLCKKYPKPDGSVFRYSELLTAYTALAGTHGISPFSQRVVGLLRKKPVRTQSGVAPITVLTKPFPCPGKCIFCPNDIRMPKSYLADEPGAQRAERNYFDPYLQTYSRLEALSLIGHTVDKAEIIVLGGTWSYYPEAYQIWFINECFRALNEFSEGIDSRKIIEQRYEVMYLKLKELKHHAVSNDPQLNKQAVSEHEIQGATLASTYNQTISKMYVAPERLAGFDTYQQATWDELFKQHNINESAQVRCVGLVVETRPDNISKQEVERIRKLGCTKTQIGVQSLQDSVLEKNKRGHSVAATRKAFSLLRKAGFKIHAHWMANLYGSSVDADKQDYLQLFMDPDFKPDELKIYPCSLIGSAELMKYFNEGKWSPYSHDELLDVVRFTMSNTPEYCRLTRVIRDIPSTDIVEGNKKTNFRQIAEQSLEKDNVVLGDIRAREIKTTEFKHDQLLLKELCYETTDSREYFLQFVTPQNKIVGFLRLSLPTSPALFDELHKAAIIREVHVYGRVVGIGKKSTKRSQHGGLGTQLLKRAEEIAKMSSYTRLAVISAVGTRKYYAARGFESGKLYQVKSLLK